MPYVVAELYGQPVQDNPRKDVVRRAHCPFMEQTCDGGKNRRLSLNSLGEFPNRDFLPVLLGVPKVVLHLLAQPAFRAAAKSLGQPNCHFRRNSNAAVQQHRQCIARYG